MGLFDFLSNKKPVRVRMAPSPTGNLHIGTARTALFNYLYAKKTGGTFVMRIEDTDRERSTKEFEKNIIDSFAWLGISWDEFYRQSERTDLYRAKLKKLIDEGKAFVSKEQAKDDETRTVEVVRLRNRKVPITFEDVIRGPITVDPSDLGDFVIARSIDDPLYHFAVVVDDGEMNITHVIRGDDHISNTPRQILILEALGYERPMYAHVPLILAPDRSKLSKRAGATSVEEYRSKGYIPEGILNFLALLGWNSGTEQELYSIEELAKVFSLEKLQKSGAIFDIERLNWFNKEHLKRLSPEEFAKRLSEFSGVTPDSRIIPLLQDRSSTLQEAEELLGGDEFAFLFKPQPLAPSMLTPRGKEEVAVADTKMRLEKIAELLEDVSENAFTGEKVKEAVWNFADKEGRGKVLWPMRVALTSAEKSPDPFTVAHLLGKVETLSRLRKAVASL